MIRATRRLLFRLLRWLVILALLPALVILVLRWVAPPTSSVIIQARIAADQPGYVRHHWVPLAEIAPALQLAVIGAEDQRFVEHWGFDLDAIEEALQERAEGGRLRGASTLSQQVAKNLFLWHGRNWLRKGLEAYLTGWIELLWPKHRILEVYLNIAQFSDRDYGADAASRGLFHIPPNRLSEHQAALMAATLPDPSDREADRPSDYLLSRAQWIQRQMRQLGYTYLDRL